MKGKNMISTASKAERIVYLDALRIVSMFAVMVIHLAATGYQEARPESYEWIICLIYNSITRFAVPVFVMISGAMYLDPKREITMAHILKRIGKLMSAFFFWSFVYAMTESLKEHMLFSAGYFQSVIEKTITGHYHMWYVYMIAGLYLATPFLRPIAADGKLLRMFILLAFLLNHGTRLLSNIPEWEEVVGAVMGSADIGIFSGFAGYYCLGYYLHSTDLSKKKIKILFAASAALLAMAIMVGILLEKPGVAFSERMPHIFIYSAGVFLLFKSGASRLERLPCMKTVIGRIAPCTLGMYLVHPMFNFIFRKAGLYALTFDPLLCVPLCSVLVCAVSFGVIFCMRKLPLLKRFA